MKRSLIFLSLCALFLSACGGESSAARADYERAIVYFRGLGTERDPAKGIEYLKKAMEKGSARAAQELGYMTLKGNGVEKSATGALAYFLFAAKRGNVDSQYNTGLAYARGDGTEKDMKEALQWFTSAALQGDAGAQFNLGLMHMNGDGVPPDPVLSYAWLSIAAENEYEGSKGVMVFLAQGMSSEQMEKTIKVIEKLKKSIRVPTPEPAPFSDSIHMKTQPL